MWLRSAYQRVHSVAEEKVNSWPMVKLSQMKDWIDNGKGENRDDAGTKEFGTQ
jgi:hypothetical protein